MILASANAQTVPDTSRVLVPVDSLARVSETVANKKGVDSVLRVHSPRKAAFRSAVLPGWGQVYNKKYWKLPIIYGALGVTGGVFFYNLNNYRDLRFAYKARYNAQFNSNGVDTPFIRQNLKRLGIEDLRYYRDEFRRNIDYTVLVFVLLWGLNVVDATVDAHLKSFDVSPDLSFRIRPGYSEMAKTNGISLVLAFK
jgi:hypothetical protein